MSRDPTFHVAFALCAVILNVYTLIYIHVQTLNRKRQTQRETRDHMMFYDVAVDVHAINSKLKVSIYLCASPRCVEWLRKVSKHGEGFSMGAP